ncbi:MAG: MOSC domain-containing protein [Planctomycetaceae bacterium]|nr:MOSC domain-containing protein [Planctomycetaceae bacterium]
MPEIVSLQVARPTAYLHQGHADGKPSNWTTAFFKTPVGGPVQVGLHGLAGDEQADKENHGGPDKAVLAYSADHYAFWRQHLRLPDMPHGGFGENLSIAGSDETTVCIGDTWRAGEILFQVTQPRQPCWKMSRRWQVADLAKQVIANGKSGWYLRVLAGGELSPGAPIELVSRPHPTWSVARASELFHHRKDDLLAVAELAALPELSAAWKASLERRIAKRRGSQ